MRPLPISLVSRFVGSSGERLGEVGFARVLTTFPRVGNHIVEYLAASRSLALGSTCQAAAAALHAPSGKRIWSHVEVSVDSCRPEDVVRTLHSTIHGPSVRSFSLFGASDSNVTGLLSVLNSAGSCEGTKQRDAFSSVTRLRLGCSSKGSAGAMEKRNRYGDSMGIGDDGFRALMLRITAVPIRGTIKTLDVSWNHIGDEAMATLCKNWPPYLTSLRLDWNFIGEVGASHLGRAVASGAAESGLQSLDLRSNPLMDQGVAAICEGVSECVSLRWLGLGETQLTDTGARHAMPFLRRHPALAGLDVGENKLTDTGCDYVAQVITDAPSLRTLLLRVICSN